MTDERVKTLPAKELGHFLSVEFFYEQTQETRLRVQASNNFQFSGISAELSKMKRSVELLSREMRRIDFKTASSLAVYAEWYTYMFE